MLVWIMGLETACIGQVHVPLFLSVAQQEVIYAHVCNFTSSFFDEFGHNLYVGLQNVG